MQKRALLLALFLMLASGALVAQGFDIDVSPLMNIPLGPNADNGARLYTLGGGARLTGTAPLPFLPVLQGRGLLEYDLVGVNAADASSLSLLTAGAGLGTLLSPAPRLTIGLFADAGYGLGAYGGKLGSSLLLQGDATLFFALSPALRLGLGAAYRYYLPFYHGLAITAGTSFHLGKGQAAGVELEEIHLEPVFPVFHTYYNTHPLGTLRIRNEENSPVTGVSVSLFVQQFMDQPKLCATLDRLEKNKSAEVPLYGLFTDRILKVTEGTEVAAEIQIEYTLLNQARRVRRSETLTVYNRNAMTWDDDRKAASFVTARDPAVLQFAKIVAGITRSQGSKALTQSLREAMGIFESLGVYGLNYVVDPKSSYLELRRNASAVDYLQFPSQTLAYRAGDCDDLSILFAALLESVAIDTAFITVPEHIYLAFALNLDQAEARKSFAGFQDLILRDGAVWMPVEVTMVQQGFLKAWKQGARLWREYEPQGKAGFHRLSEAWKSYVPTGFEGTEPRMSLPDENRLVERYVGALRGLVAEQIGGRVNELQAEIKKRNDPSTMNRLGILYARYGLYKEAEAEFRRAGSRQFLPAQVNLANLFYLQGQGEQALLIYRQAYAASPENPCVLLGLAKVYYKQGDYEAARKFHEQLKTGNPELAGRYAYLSSAQAKAEVRAADLAMKEAVSWDGEN